MVSRYPDHRSHRELSMNDAHAGGCVCGAVRYRAYGRPILGTVCHCTHCQRRLASAFAVLVTFPEQSVEVTQGVLAECEHRSDESGRWLKMKFCPKCGTTVYHAAEVRPGARTIAGGTFDDPTWFTINRHIWVKSKLPWIIIPSSVETFDQGFVASKLPSATAQISVALNDKPALGTIR